jgi:lipopolysaccharide/colanic/teichoic acid biosynthesis glycosyltransferase
VDIVGSLVGLVLLSPLLLAVTVVIKVVSPGPVLFRQQRVGYMGKKFTMWKFRTMKLKVDISRHRQHISELVNNGQPMTKLDDESQLIPFGKILRATSLDELPQLINVLCGQMSLVGPRPPIPYEVEEYLGWYNARFDVIPGMTGLWQVRGKNRLTFDEMARLDIQYSREMSPWLDTKILLMTPYAVISEFKDSLANNQARMKGAIKNG